MSASPTLLERFHALKTGTPGNREKTRFEFTMGPVKETLFHVTGVPAYITRILSQVDFALKLSAEAGGKHDDIVEHAIEILEKSQVELGVITKPSADQAEKALLPLQNAAKEYEVLFASHAHIDMNWQWGWEETVAATLATFRTILGMMDEYPQFTFSQSQASVYKIVEDYAPELMPAIKQRIAEGRWEITATAWVETDKNMPDTESLIRHIEQTRKYLRNTWDVDPASLKVDFSPDTFGHSAFLPELNTFGEVPYYYHCRGHQTKNILYRWIAPSGSEILIYMEPFWYNSGVNPESALGAIDIAKINGGLKTSLIVYGVGDHGGGPTRRDIEQVLEMKEWPVFPQLTFGTLHEYFKRAESVRENLPVADYELNTIFAGCYTTQSRVKRGNRRAEAALLDAEALIERARIQANLPVSKATSSLLDGAWRNVLFTHFHDILTGSCVPASREHAMGLYQHAMAVAQSRQEAAMLALSRNIDTSMIAFDDASGTQSEGAGVGYGIDNFSGVPRPERGRGKVRAFHVFNPLTQPRSEIVELTVWDWTYDLRRLTVTDESGAPLPFQLLDPEQNRYWDHNFVRVLVKTAVPALGHSTVVISEKRLTDYSVIRYEGDRVQLPLGEVTLENEHLRVVINGQTGGIAEFYDKDADAERLIPGTTAGFTLIDTEAATSNAWRIGRYLNEWSLIDCDERLKCVSVSEDKGSLRHSVTIEYKILNSTAKAVISLDDGATELAAALEIDWNETSHSKPSVPVLVWRADLRKEPDAIRMDVPAGSVDRSEQAQDWAGLTHAAAVYGERALQLVSDCKYGYRADNGSLAITLINTANSPDWHPERGVHHIKLWMSATESKPVSLKAAAQRLNHALSYVSATKHGGDLTAKGESLNVNGPCVVTSVGTTDDGALRIRLYESEGKQGEATISAPWTFGKVAAVDLEGKVINKADVDAGSVKIALEPHKLYEIRIK
ncbi:alpha-mannosidase [Clostridia bacterium]|nr:alpha-mannosidase [Clostridia bacterium]